LVKATPTLQPEVYLVGLDTTVAGKRFGERFDFIIGQSLQPIVK